MQTSRCHFLTRVAIRAIQAYRKYLSPHMLPSCRFVPSCSAYAEESFRKHGFLRGSAFTLARLVRCQPLCRPGMDPVK